MCARFNAIVQQNSSRLTYTLDATGNRTGIDYNATTYLYTIAATSNRLTKVAGPVVKTYLYDAAGNPTSDGVITFTWDAANRLNTIASGKGSSAVSASYLYNGLGQRLLKTANVLTNAPWRYVYDEAGHLIGEYDKNNAARQETVWLDDTPVVVVKQTAPSTQTIYFVQADHLNTPRVILNSTNTPIWRWDNSDAFGVGLPDEDPDKDTVKFEYNPRFPGQYFDKETNLHYNGFRDYEPRTGRYVEADPIGLAGGLNLYAYVEGNPINKVDPLGLKGSFLDWLDIFGKSKCTLLLPKILAADKACDAECTPDSSFPDQVEYMEKYSASFLTEANMKCICAKLGKEICKEAISCVIDTGIDIGIKPLGGQPGKK